MSTSGITPRSIDQIDSIDLLGQQFFLEEEIILQWREKIQLNIQTYLDPFGDHFSQQVQAEKTRECVIEVIVDFNLLCIPLQHHTNPDQTTIVMF